MLAIYERKCTLLFQYLVIAWAKKMRVRFVRIKAGKCYDNKLNDKFTRMLKHDNLAKM